MSGLVYEVNTDPERVAESNTEMIMSVLSVFHFVALVFVSLRLYARVVVIKSPGKDDWTMVLAALFAFGGGWITFLLQSQRGLGKHTDTISREDKVIFDKLSFWQSVLSATCALGLLKISIAFNLLRLSKSRWYKLALWATIGEFVYPPELHSSTTVTEKKLAVILTLRHQSLSRATLSWVS